MKIIPAIFEEREIRCLYDEKSETWFFSVVDIIQVLTQQPDYQAARNYWKVLKNRLAKEGSQLVTNCNQLKLPAADGKKYLTDVANAETLLRLVQSVPSPKAEPIKLWLAKVGYERMQEIADPGLSLERARATWQKHGRSDKWIQQRMTGQETRNKLTDYWAEHEIKKGEEYAILTNLIHQEWSGVSVKSHKELKNLKTQNLRDHMSEAELIFTALAELSTRQDRRNHRGHGHGGKPNRRQVRRQHRQTRPAGTRSHNRQTRRDWRKLPAARQGPKHPGCLRRVNLRWRLGTRDGGNELLRPRPRPHLESGTDSGRPRGFDGDLTERHLGGHPIPLAGPEVVVVIPFILRCPPNDQRDEIRRFALKIRNPFRNFKTR